MLSCLQSWRTAANCICKALASQSQPSLSGWGNRRFRHTDWKPIVQNPTAATPELCLSGYASHDTLVQSLAFSFTSFWHNQSAVTLGWESILWAKLSTGWEYRWHIICNMQVIVWSSVSSIHWCCNISMIGSGDSCLCKITWGIEISNK